MGAPVKITAKWAADPATSTDAHVPVTVTLINDSKSGATVVDLVPAPPLGTPYADPVMLRDPVEVAAGESQTLEAVVHLTQGVADAPAEPEFTVVLG